MRVNPNKRIIAQFPFKGAIKPLTGSERSWARDQIGKLQNSLPEPLVHESLSYDEYDNHLLFAFRYAAEKFGLENVPKELPVDHSGDLDHAWDEVAATHFASVTRRMFGDRKVKVLQLASNYGPILFYLEKCLKADVFGVEPKREAIDYASSMGTRYIKMGFAQDIPYPDETFDAVYSRHCLCNNYPRAFYPWADEDELNVIGAEKDRVPGMILPHVLKILWQVQRVLKPGGLFISSDEDTITPETASLHFSRYWKVERSPVRMVQK